MGVEIEQNIKLVIGTIVVVVMLVGAYFIFKNKIMDFFNGVSAGTFIALLR